MRRIALPPGPEAEAPVPGATGSQLYRKVAAAKHRWLARVMGSPVPLAQKCLAWAIAENLNCVTLDSWMKQERLKEALSAETTRTVNRAARGLAEAHFITITHWRRDDGKATPRYAPVFIDEDWDRNVRRNGQKGPADPDRNVHQSLIENPLDETPAVLGREDGAPSGTAPSRGQRGKYEVEVAQRLGDNGFDILIKLARLDDRIVQRLCRAQAEGVLGRQELLAARLAAEQLR